jgi:hypothetical protein
MRPGGVIGGSSEFAPNPLDTFLASFLQAKQQKSSESAEARRFELAQSQLDIEKEKWKTQQAQLAHAQEIIKQQGGAVQQFLKGISPLIEQQGQFTPPGQNPPILQGIMGPGQPPTAPPLQTPAPMAVAPAPVQAPATPQAPPTWGELVGGMDPEAAAQFVHEQVPQLLAIQKQMNPTQEGQAVQTGDTVTTFVPGKGFWDANANGGKGGWVPAIQRRMQPDELELKRLQLEEARQRIGAMKDYRTAMMAQSMTKQFNGREKDLQQRGAIINQALQTISDAMNNPDPNQRKVLYSSAIANFVQAADQKAQLRYQMLQYFKNNVDPSVAGKWDVLKTRLLQGTLPQYVGQGMLHHLQNLLTLTGGEYDKQRSAEVKRHPELGNWLPEKNEFFDPMTVGASMPDGSLMPPP